jgi:hypothetical protein
MRASLWSVLAVLATFTACAPMQLPQDFVELGAGGDGYRGVTADDARLRVRDFYDSTEGSVDFWADTLSNDCVQQRGYELIGRGELVDRDGESGRWLQFAANAGGEKVGVYIAVWVRSRLLRKDYLQVAEFAARDAVFTARLPAVKQALATLRR